MQKTVTIRTLAKELGLSVSAVSKALNDYPDIGAETKALVQRKAAELGYTPNLLARNLARKTSDFVGIVIRDVSSVYGEMFKCMSGVARRLGLHLILYDTDNDPDVEKRCVQNLVDSMAMGIVIAPVSGDVTEIIRMTRGRVPVVFLGGRVRNPKVNYVCADSRAGTEMALEHLIALGHCRIAMIFDDKQSASRSTRLEVYRRRMKKLGEPERVCTGTSGSADILTAGYELGRRMIAEGTDATAVLAVKDMMALGLLQAFTEAGRRVPEDLSVIGYDGIDAAGLPLIGLTTVAQPRMEMAEHIFDMIIRHAEDPSLPQEHYLVRPELIERSTCAAPAGLLDRDFRQDDPV